MAKIMLVEDDNNLREIYEARLLAEGHEIISAHDGEEALALAVREKPELIISDVMMPKISGFDMLDILRSSPETKHTKVIMMTALSQLEDKDRADRLGADRYLVKSQVTLEDVIRVTREVLESPAASGDDSTAMTEPLAPIGGGTPTPAEPSQPTQDQSAAPQPATDASAVDNATMPAAPAPMVNDPAINTPVSATPDPVSAPAPDAVAAPPQDNPAPSMPDGFISNPAPTETPAPVEPTPTETTNTIPSPEVPVNINEQINQAQTSDDEKNEVEQQINDFINNTQASAPVPATPDPVSAPAPDAVATPVQDNPAPSMPDGFISNPAPTETPAPVEPTPTETTPAAEPASTPEVTPTEQQSVQPAQSVTPPKKTIQPLHDPTATPDLNALAAKEAEMEAAQSILNNAAQEPASPSQVGQQPEDPNTIAL